MKRKITRFALGAILLAFSFSAEAQQPQKIRRIGYLTQGAPSTSSLALKAFPELAADLVRVKVDVIVASGTRANLAAKNATGAIPIVMANSDDPLGSGLV